ncbi:MAG: RluA family pseudouridine synthase [candidate division NC10 bacterium]|nr:RluA family pseudouridine synthase [candidate division NC10 bacterium]
MYEVPPSEAGRRLDQFLVQSSGLSRSAVQRLMDQEQVRIGEQPRKASYRVRARDRVILVLPPPEPSGIEPEPIPLDLLYEDQDLLVVNKPSGLVVHPGTGRRRGTLVNALLHHCPGLTGIGGVERPGIVHRLDKETSGCLVVAKTEMAHQDLTRQFQARQVKKTYLALVHGSVRTGQRRIALPIGRHERERKRMGVRSRKGRETETIFRVLKSASDWSLVEVMPTTGRTHQIRVHLAAIGHPVVGDKLYGGRRERKSQWEVSRQLLHAWKLSFSHPRTGLQVESTAPLPRDFHEILDRLGFHPSKELHGQHIDARA